MGTENPTCGRCNTPLTPEMRFANLFTCDECAVKAGLQLRVSKNRFTQLADEAKRILVDWDTGRISRIELLGLLDRAVQACKDQA